MKLTDQEINDAKEISTIDIISETHGFTFKKESSCWKCKEHDSLVIFSNGKGWKWFSQDIGGKNAIDWLVKIEGEDFRDAVLHLIGKSNTRDYTPTKKYKKSEEIKIEPPKELTLPEAIKEKYTNVYMYLTATRKIASEVVVDCFKKKIVYQDTRNNVVFVGYDENGVPKYASKRGTYTPKDGKAYKRDCVGSDKSYGFLMQGTLAHQVYVFEAPIDALSHATLTLEKSKGMGLADYKESWKKYTRLALGGVSDVALERYIKTNPDLKEISFCLDNDEAGQKNANQYKEKYEKLGYKVNIYAVPQGYGKDYNEFLCGYIEFKNKKLNRTAKETVHINNHLQERGKKLWKKF